MPAGAMAADQVAKPCSRIANSTEVKLDGMRRTIAARLSEAKQTIPHFYLRRDIRLDALLKPSAAHAEQATGRRAA
jgi:pyruvate dehydrogenase E2 component (dihydrolipoamide acetyltransferase)